MFVNKNSVKLIDILLFSVAVIWAFNFTAVKIALQEFPPLGFNTLRFLASAVFFMVFYHYTIGDYAFVKKYFWKLVLLGFVGNTLLQVCFVFGVKFTSASNASFMYSTVPMLVAFLSAVFKYEKVYVLAWIGVVISFMGIALVVSTSGSGLNIGAGNIFGDILILVCALLWSLFTVLSKPLIHESSTIKVVSLTFVFGTILLVPFGMYDLLTMDYSAISLEGWGYFTFSFIFANVFAYTVWFYGVAKIGNVQTAIYQNMVPVFAVCFAMVYLNERLIMSQILGGIGIIGGVTLTRLSATGNRTAGK